MTTTTLGVRSDFSLGESLLQIPYLVDACKAAGYDTVALADTMTISALPSFTELAKKAGIRPIIGARLRVYDDGKYRPPKKNETHEKKPNPFFMPKVFPINENGLRSLMRLLSTGFSEDYFYFHARVGLAELLALEDCIVTTGDLYNLFAHPDAELPARLHAHFGDRLYAEVAPVNTPLFDRGNAAAVRSGIQVIASTPFLYREQDDAAALEVLAAITANKQMDDRSRSQQFVKTFVVEPKSALRKRLIELGGRLKAHHDVDLAAFARSAMSALENAERFAARIQYGFTKMPICLPKMADDEYLELLTLAAKGFKQRFSKPVLGHKPTDMKPYVERFKYELGTLRKMGFEGYFLLVQDLVNHAKAQGIMVGPGRGSVGGSLIAYCLGITDVDPLRFNLLFERFINPERLDLPDADLDFMTTRRHEVMEYLRQRYGHDRVAGISNYTSLASASALRDAARVHGLHAIEYACTKLVPKEHGIPLSLSEAAEKVPELEKFRAEHTSLWNTALKLEGAMRGYGQHPGGVIVAGEDLITRSVLEVRQESRVVNWDKRSVEDFGLVKMDILGVAMLDVLALAKTLIADRNGGDTVDYLQIPLDDEKTLHGFAESQTVGVFQFESPGMRKLLKDIANGGKFTFDDIAAAIALYRPGPMDSGLLDDYVSIRQGFKTAFYQHPKMAPALADTYGVMVYQEQVMQISRDVAGYTLADADHLRKAMGKKDKEKMAEQREKFVAGCVATSEMQPTIAGELFDQIETFAGYGFNKSHAVEYSILAFWSMYLKQHYPAEFYAAALTIADDESKLQGLVIDAKRHEFEVYPPDINESGLVYHVSGNRLLAPFHAVKGISTNVAKFIVEAQEKGARFTDRADFEAIVNKSKCNTKHRQALEDVGAFATITPGSPGPLDPLRLKSQLELLPGIITQTPKAERKASVAHLKPQIIHFTKDYQACEGCTLQDEPHPLVVVGREDVRFMMVFDGPNYWEGKKGKYMVGDSADMVREVFKEAGVDLQDGYYTGLMKAVKPKGEKFFTNEQINGCTKHLQRELELIKPPIIITMGNNATRFFLPDVKSAAEMAGKHVFRADLDATIVVGVNPGAVHHDPSKKSIIVEVAGKVLAMLT